MKEEGNQRLLHIAPYNPRKKSHQYVLAEKTGWREEGDTNRVYVENRDGNISDWKQRKSV